MASKFNLGKRLRVTGHKYRKMDYGAALRCGCSCENRFMSKRWHPSFKCIFLYLLMHLLTYLLTYMYLLTWSSHNLGKRFRPRAKIVYQILLTLRLSGPEAFTKSTCWCWKDISTFGKWFGPRSFWFSQTNFDRIFKAEGPNSKNICFVRHSQSK